MELPDEPWTQEYLHIFCFQASLHLCFHSPLICVFRPACVFCSPLTCVFCCSPLICVFCCSHLMCIVYCSPLMCVFCRSPLTCVFCRSPLMCVFCCSPLLCVFCLTNCVCVHNTILVDYHTVSVIVFVQRLAQFTTIKQRDGVRVIELE